MKCDVIVVGGSTAGLFSAEILAKAGKKVILFEQADSPTSALRTYIITPNLYQVLPNFEQDLILHQSRTFYLQTGNRQSVLEFTSPDLVLDRKELISSLMKRAKNAGVELHYGSEFKGISMEDGNPQIEILSEDGLISYQADNLIAADGIKNSVGKAVGLPDPQVVSLRQAEVALPEGWDPDVTRIWFEVEDTSYFYWFIPDSDKGGVLGLIADKGIDITGLLDQFLVKQGITALGFQSGTAALHTSSLRNETSMGKLRILRVGDAAGQVKNTTVGGTVTGLVGAKAAAEAILKRITYKRTFRRGKRELDLHAFIRKLLDRMNQSDYRILIESMTPSVLSFLRSNNRDSMRAQFWKLVFIQPRFIPLGLKLVLKK